MMKTKLSLVGLALVGFLMAGCDQTAPQESSAKTEIYQENPKTPEEQAAQRQRLVKMEEIARRTNTTWDQLNETDKQPYLDFHQGKEPGAKKHYEEMVLMIRDEQN
jgi:hypothetical protein